MSRDYRFGEVHWWGSSLAVAKLDINEARFLLDAF